MPEELISGMGFRGMSPATGDEALEANQAAFAQNVDLFRGVIRPTRADTALQSTVFNFDADQTATKKRIFALPGTETGSFVIVSAVFDHAASAVNVNGELEVWLSGQDTSAMRFRRGRSGSGFVIYDSTVYENVTVPKPAVTVTRVTASDPVTRYATVRLSFVYADGYETPLGPSSDEFGYVPEDTLQIEAVDVSGSSVAPSAIRVYISVSTSTGVEMRYFGEIVEAGYTSTFVIPNDVTGEAIEDYDTLPADVRCVCAAPWGGFAFTTAAKPGVLQFTDSLMMRKVLTEYELNLGGTVKALLQGTTAVFALCGDSGPFVVSGTALSNLVVNPGSVVSPLVSSPVGAAVFNDTCLFVGAHGLMAVSSSGTVTTFTEEPIFSKDQWAALVPTGIALAFASDGSVVFASGTGRTGILKPYGLVWKSGVRRAFATLPHDKSIVYL